MIYALIVLGIVSLDLFSKRYIKKTMFVGEKKEITPRKMYLWHLKNNGVAYNLFAKEDKLIIYGSGIAIIGIFMYLLKLIFKGSQTLVKLSYSLLLGGALGNFLDRLKNKTVTDFIYIEGKHLPIFNFADIFVLLGVISSLCVNIDK